VSYREIKMKYDGSIVEYACQLLEYTSERVVLFYVLPASRVVDEVTLPKGTYTIAYYWGGRTFNTYHWITPEGKTLAYYFNLADRTVIQPDLLSWRDLILDVIHYPSGVTKVLDEEELPLPLDQFEDGRVQKSLEELLNSMDEIVREASALTEKGLKEWIRKLSGERGV
jgi:predicted RNA-binding protein associated with RNAse of E/G family